jgi:1-acyl-sn-glycerol-3-phosphate acyltransferase
MAHRMMSYGGPLAVFASKCGALEGKRHNAVRVLEADEGFVVYPGGEADMGRTWWERNKTDFRGHAGFVRSAIIGKAPLVPFGSIGAHEIEFVLLRGERIARMMRLHRLAHVSSWPLALTLPWGLQWGYFPYLPFPSRMEFRIGKPIEISPDEKEAFDLEYQHSVRDLLEARVQDLIDELLQARRARRPGSKEVEMANRRKQAARCPRGNFSFG